MNKLTNNLEDHEAQVQLNTHWKSNVIPWRLKSSF